MDENGLKENDPYRGMETAEKDIRPDYLSSTDKEKERAARAKRAVANLGDAEKGAEDADLNQKSDNLAGARAVEKKAGGGFYSGGGKKTLNLKKGVFRGLITRLGPIIGVFLLLFVIMGILTNIPNFLIGNLDFNLMKSLGFEGTTAILEEQAEHVTEEMALNGELPAEYAKDLVAAGLDVGQVTVAGDFVRTNKYVANIEELDEVAVVGSGFHVNASEGELAFLFDGEVIEAENFVAAVESNPKMYAAFSEGANISAKYYYGESVSGIYSELGLSRSAFVGWEPTGDTEEDQKNYEELAVKSLDGDGNGDLTGCRNREVIDKADGEYTGNHPCSDETLNDHGWINNELVESPYNASESISGKSGSTVTGDMVNTSFDNEDPTERAAQVLSSALSSSEPLLAMRAFLTLESTIQMARAGDNGPVNQAMNMLYEGTEVEYTDVGSGKLVKTSKPIIETGNFIAAASQGGFSKEEGQNFSRDRVLNVTNSGKKSLVDKTMVNNDKQKEYKPMMEYRMNVTLEPVYDGAGNVVNKRVVVNSPQPDAARLSKSDNSMSLAVEKKNSEVYKSEVGGNRIVNGGSVLNDTLNQHVLGAMASDSDTVLAYNHDVNERLAIREAADRATRSPLDISSPNTFMGSITSGMVSALIRNGGFTSNTSIVSSMNAAVDYASTSANKLAVGDVMADGVDSDFMTTFGKGCEVVTSIGLAAHLDCSQVNTIETGYMNKTKSYWDKEIDKDDYEDFVGRAMDRWTPSGVVDANICEEISQDGGILSKIFYKILDLLGLGDSYDKCKGHEDEASGKNYSLSSVNKNLEKTRKFSAYTLHDVVYSLLSGEKSEAAKIIEKRRAEQPLDKSEAGIISRVSGMKKEDVELALEYANYLTAIAQYDASNRYAFGEAFEKQTQSKLVGHTNKMSSELYCFWRGGVEYGNMRDRNFVV